MSDLAPEHSVLLFSDRGTGVIKGCGAEARWTSRRRSEDPATIRSPHRWALADRTAAGRPLDAHRHDVLSTARLAPLMPRRPGQPAVWPSYP